MTESNNIPSVDVVVAVPTSFRAGDLIEASIEFAAFPTGTNQAVTVVVLKAIRMISPELRNVSIRFYLMKPPLTSFQRAGILTMRSRYKTSKYPAFAIKRKSTDGPTGTNEPQERSKRVKDDNNNEVFIENVSSTQNTTTAELEEAQERMIRMQVSDPHVDP